MELKKVAINSIVTGISRRPINRERLKELADSIREIGIEEPLLVRQIAGDKYQLIDGNTVASLQRWRGRRKWRS